MATEITEPVRGRKKKGGMKRLKGFITGQSRREKKRAKDASKSEYPDDASTLYGADLDASVAGDAKSVSSASIATAAAKQPVYSDPVQIILLIMDPASRRFELLHLEFDSANSKVSDIFAQIPDSATEEVLQKATYRAVITPKGEELKSDSNLSEVAERVAVVIAVPESTEESLEKVASMAIPILTNPKVHKMLLSVGIKAEDLPKKPTKKKVEKIVEEPKKEEPAQPPKLIEETEPLKPIDEVPVEPLKNVDVKKADEDETSYFVVGILFAIFAHLFFKAHMSISAPLVPGSTMALGKTKNSCGLLGSVPFFPCEPKSVSLGTDGIMQVFEGDELVYSLEGSVCGADSDDCVDGLVVAEDGTLVIGGETAKATMKPTTSLSPWPFSEEVLFNTGLRQKFMKNLKK